MASNLLIFSDGTSNTRQTRTNVYQCYELLKNQPGHTCFYDPGVGHFNLDLPGKAFGLGLCDNIQQCYEFIVNHYQADTQLFLFGFSRGAYTMRSLANFIHMVGLVEPNQKNLAGNGPRRRYKQKLTIQKRDLQRAFRVYQKNQLPGFRQRVNHLHQQQPMRSARVFCMALWDTVGAVGLPQLDKNRPAYKKHAFHRVGKPDKDTIIYHALAIDEARREFAPVLFRKRPANTEEFQEVWFPGSHSDVGGGYRVTKADPKAKSLSNLSLAWMLEKLAPHLSTKPSLIPKGDPCGPMHDSRAGLAEHIHSKMLRKLPRHSWLHSSVLSRLQGPVEAPNVNLEPDGHYRPPALSAHDFSLVTNKPDFDLNSRYQLLN